MTQDSIHFLLGGKRKDITNIDPSTSLLDYLRYHRARTGTKEGCGEGDCGACTVVVGSLKNGKLYFEAVNACILFLPTLDGKLILTVEDLVSPEGRLHPVQQAMADLHGSQCGFCTPGFVMSIYAHLRSGGGQDLDSINNALVGNLCRCTGYGPIIDATRQVLSETLDDHLSALEADWIRELEDMTTADTLALSWTCSHTGAVKKYFAPKTADALAELMATYPDETLLAGGTDVGLWVTKQLRDLPCLIYLGQIVDLKQISESKDLITIGAGVSYAEALPALNPHFPDLGEVIRRIGSTQIRNSGTLGGNIANGSPIGDSSPLLIALDSTLVLQSAKGVRRLPLEEYFIAYGKQDLRAGEFVAAIEVPKLDKDQHFRAFKISKRFDQDISAVCAAFNITLEKGLVSNARIAYGGMAATPARAMLTEKVLIGAPWTISTIEAAMVALETDFRPIGDMRSSADYRMKVAQNLLLKCYHEQTTPDATTRLVGHNALGGTAHV
ncbi:xanthine dehydrogenase small subunit [Paremcibacter congregatus]|uniref:xanthine dehydrogenase small subunit n=1 Tax=Paremcibacter congregatus TaxID=2043170 RepID=UPI0030EDB4DC|tara:strand:- start:1506 stop:3002 length:1497 start_codon:yes stop_codon:yes gene_type:complete